MTLNDEVYGRSGIMHFAYSNSILNLSKANILDHTFSISIDSVERFNEDSSNSLLMIGAGYISYGLTIIRGEDLMKQTIWKRFKEIAAFHAEVWYIDLTNTLFMAVITVVKEKFHQVAKCFFILSIYSNQSLLF